MSEIDQLDLLSAIRALNHTIESARSDQHTTGNQIDHLEERMNKSDTQFALMLRQQEVDSQRLTAVYNEIYIGTNGSQRSRLEAVEKRSKAVEDKWSVVGKLGLTIGTFVLIAIISAAWKIATNTSNDDLRVMIQTLQKENKDIKTQIEEKPAPKSQDSSYQVIPPTKRSDLKRELHATDDRSSLLSIERKSQ